jgi:RNA polymerase primary sigma factor
VLKSEQIEDFYTYLLDRSIELVEGEQDKEPPHEQPAVVEDDGKGTPKLDLSVEPSLDSLYLYLREIGKVPLVCLTKRVEHGEGGGQEADNRGPLSGWWPRSRSCMSGAASRSST